MKNTTNTVLNVNQGLDTKILGQALQGSWGVLENESAKYLIMKDHCLAKFNFVATGTSTTLYFSVFPSDDTIIDIYDITNETKTFKLVSAGQESIVIDTIKGHRYLVYSQWFKLSKQR